MTYLFLSIFFATALFVIFKFFKRYTIDSLKAIVVNYIVACSFGFASSETSFYSVNIFEKPWFYGCLLLGLLFVSVFFIMALTTQENGVAVASVAGKMSVIIPVLFGILYYHESISVRKGMGIALALASVYLVSARRAKNDAFKRPTLLYPLLLFLGTGIIDTSLKYLQVRFVAPEDVAVFSSSLFGFAACYGILLVAAKWWKEKKPFGLRNVLAGIALGIPNYYSLFFLIKAFQIEEIESSTLFTVNNVGIVLGATLIGRFFFQERLSTKNKIGVLLAIAGIVLVANA